YCTGVTSPMYTSALPPKAKIKAPPVIWTGTPAAFDGTSSTPGSGTIASYEWDFGDGTTGSGGHPSHTYAVAGPYHVTLTVTNTNGASSHKAAPVLAQDRTPIQTVTGDVNGDGYADVVAFYKRGDAPAHTAAWVFSGSSTGLGAPSVQW